MGDGNYLIAIYTVLWIVYAIWLNRKNGIEAVERLRKILSLSTMVPLLYITWFTEPKPNSKWFDTIGILVMFGSVFLICNKKLYDKAMEEAKQANFPQFSYFAFQALMVVVCANMSFTAIISIISYILTGDARKFWTH
ncbi:hypothetical protein FACS189487_10110 [Campylobacterota bacterium]|nr:hypothetical protein FACS189487_10110 [Campylobacterota bacterium]